MTSTSDPISLDGADDPAAVLAYARARKAAEDDEAREVHESRGTVGGDALRRLAGRTAG